MCPRIRPPAYSFRSPPHSPRQKRRGALIAMAGEREKSRWREQNPRPKPLRPRAHRCFHRARGSISEAFRTTSGSTARLSRHWDNRLSNSDLRQGLRPRRSRTWKEAEKLDRERRGRDDRQDPPQTFKSIMKAWADTGQRRDGPPPQQGGALMSEAADSAVEAKEKNQAIALLIAILALLLALA